MKKVIKYLSIILFMSLFMINVKGASSFSNYNDAVKNTDSYITRFNRYKLFIDKNNKYLYNGSSLSKSSGILDYDYI